MSEGSKLPRVTEISTEPIIGNRYIVPCVLFHYDGDSKTTWLPVIGSPHDDKEIIGFQWLHWHVDWRFMNKPRIRALGAHECWLKTTRCFGRVIGVKPGEVNGSHAPRDSLTEKRLKCIRQMPWLRARYQSEPSGAQQVVPFLKKLEDAYEGSRLNPVKPICPHKWLPLNGQPLRNGCLICPGHGLCFDALTGQMVRRT